MKKTIITIISMLLTLSAYAAGPSSRGSQPKTSNGMEVESADKQAFYILSEYIPLIENVKTMEELEYVQKSYSESLRIFKSKFPKYKGDQEAIEIRDQIDKAFKEAHRRVLRKKSK